MSRIGKKPIIVPQGVKVNLANQELIVEGPKGKLKFKLQPFIKTEIKDSRITLSCNLDTKFARSIFGLSRSLLSNMIKGVTEGFSKQLEIVGTGFRASTQANTLNLQLGFSHPVTLTIPEGIKVITPKPTQIEVSGIDKIKVGEVAATIRKIFPPEPYKGKGIRYKDEIVRRKIGKVVTK